MGILVFWLGLSIIVVTYMTLWYLIGLYTNRYDVVDSAWGLGFVLIAWTSLALRAHFGTAQLVSAALISLWGLRLFGHIANRNWRKKEDDHRYQVLRANWGAGEKHKAYANVFLLQGFLMILISLPMIGIALVPGIRPTFITYVGWTLWVAGIIFEATSDRQLASFIKRRTTESVQIMDGGLWRYSRHPNYFGEVTAWWGAAVAAASLGAWWGLLGAAVITILITKVSGIPPLEKHYEDNDAYEDYRKRTSIFLPLPPRKP